jgi:tetratricopeptide (TPR) repeat protein
MTSERFSWSRAHRIGFCALAVAAFGFLPAGAAPAHPHAHGGQAAPAAAKAPLFPNLGPYHRPITTRSPKAQRYFDQGMALLYAFNLEEAQRSFEAAAAADPRCAICRWGVAMALAPHINLPALPERTVAAHRAAAEAVKLAKGASAVERALIAAVARRSAEPPPADPAAQRALDSAYADAMREVAKRFPVDMDAQALFAEAMMDLRPWDLWTADGKPQPGTAEILATLERALTLDANHPGANHYYIHAVEASPHPEKALDSADRIGALIPGAAHIVHMPSHIYARVGRWDQASEANRQAIAVDRAYIEQVHPQGFYFMYVAHNFQFLQATAAMEGRSAEALANAREVVAHAPLEMLRQMPGNDFVLGYPIWALVRFGRFAEVVAEPAPPVGFPYANAVWHAARGIAFARLGKLDEAAAEEAAVARAAAELPADATEALNPAAALTGIARDLTAGEIAAARGDLPAAVERFESAVKAEDGLRYNEPPDWYLSTRHALGAALARAGRDAEAQAVWEEDLRRQPENGWALAGLAASLGRQKKEAEAAAVEARLRQAWSQADVPLPRDST